MDDLDGTPAPGVLCPPAGLVPLQSFLEVVGDPGVEAAVAAAKHVDCPHHEYLRKDLHLQLPG